MAQEPFAIVSLRSCRDLIQVRHRARQIAQLLRFSPHDVIAIAAGTFAVAHQATRVLGRAELCFAIVERQLRVFARPRRQRAELPENLYRLSKHLPSDENRLAEDDIRWLIQQVEILAPTHLEEELARQNQETLTLLAALGLGKTGGDVSGNPSAA